MRKNMMKKIIAVTLVLAMAAAFVAAAPADKAGEKSPVIYDSGDMTVYVMTNAGGKAEKLYLTDKLAEALPEGKESRGLPMYNSDGIKLEKPSIGDELPIEIKVSYTLDGRKISPKKLAGKSGHVVIHYDYENLCKTKAVIGGGEEEIYVPFAVVTGLVLDDERFSNVEVSSGKVISDGSRSIVAGVALPGLQSNLDISKDIIELPEFVEIAADVENFDLAMSLSLVTNDIFGDSEDMSYDTSDIQEMLNQLRGAMDMLIDGAAQLYNGIDMLAGKSGELVDGVTQLHQGMQELDSHSAELSGGAGLVFDSMLNMGTNVIIKLGLGDTALTRENYAQVLSELINSLDANVLIDAALDKIIETMDLGEIRKAAELLVMHDIETTARQAEYDRIRAEIMEQGDSLISREAAENNVRAQAVIIKTAEVREEILSGILGGGDYESLSPLEKAAVEAKVAVEMAKPETAGEIKSRVEGYMASEEAQALIESKVADGLELKVGAAIVEQHEAIEHNVRAAIDAEMETPEAQARVQEVYENMVREAALALLTEDIKAQIQNMADEGTKALGELLAGLTGYEQFYCGVQAYTAGVSTAAAGVATLYSNMPALTSGVGQLHDGSEMLYEGVLQFDREGISRITNLMDGEVGELRDRIKASYDAAKEYKGVSGLDEDIPCVSFVYRGAAISAD